MNKAVLVISLVVVTMSMVMCNKAINTNHDDLELVQFGMYQNRDEASHIWIHQIKDDWVNIELVLAGTEGTHRVQATIKNLKIVLTNEHWCFVGIIEPIGEPFNGPPPQADKPVDQYICGSVIIDGSAALVAVFQNHRYLEYAGPTAIWEVMPMD